MPYISPNRRLNAIPCTGAPIETAGELNFAITTLVHRFINRDGISYASLNAAIGVLECAKLELYRRIAAPYEDTKIVANGEVSPRVRGDAAFERRMDAYAERMRDPVPNASAYAVPLSASAEAVMRAEAVHPTEKAARHTYSYGHPIPSQPADIIDGGSGEHHGG